MYYVDYESLDLSVDGQVYQMASSLKVLGYLGFGGRMKESVWTDWKEWGSPWLTSTGEPGSPDLREETREDRPLGQCSNGDAST